MKRIKKRCLIISGILFTLAFIFFGFYNFVNYRQSLEADKILEEDNQNELNVHYMDVGQSECILITQGNEAMLIDAGGSDAERRIKSYADSIGISSFKYIIGTKPDEEHIGALDYVVKSFDVENVIYPKEQAETQAFSNFINECNDKGLSVTFPKMEDKFMLGEAECTIFIQSDEDSDSNNEYPMIIKVKYGDNSFLFEGSSQEKLQKQLTADNADLKADVIKLRSKEAESESNDEFFDAVNPDYAVITGFIGGPMMKFESRNIKTFKTNTNGTIVASSNGENISFSVEKIDWQSWITGNDNNHIPFEGKMPGDMPKPPKEDQNNPPEPPPMAEQDGDINHPQPPKEEQDKDMDKPKPPREEDKQMNEHPDSGENAMIKSHGQAPEEEDGDVPVGIDKGKPPKPPREIDDNRPPKPSDNE